MPREDRRSRVPTATGLLVLVRNLLVSREPGLGPLNLLGIDIIRVVNIEGVDQQADGGTHVANTTEVGRVRVTKSENKGRINKRLEIVVE